MGFAFAWWSALARVGRSGHLEVRLVTSRISVALRLYNILLADAGGLCVLWYESDDGTRTSSADITEDFR